MADTKREFLVILDPDQGRDLFQRISSQYKIAQSLPPRVLIPLLDAREAREIAALPGVTSVCEAAVPPHVMETLTDGESLFASAWAERHQAAPKKRVGEGLAWDAPGFEPPDASKEGEHGR